jgi:hypothetical protein
MSSSSPSSSSLARAAAASSAPVAKPNSVYLLVSQGARTRGRTYIG